MTEKLKIHDYVILALVTALLNYFWVVNTQLYVIHGTPLLTFINYHHESGLYATSLLIKGFTHYYTYYFPIAILLSQYMPVEMVTALLSLVPGLVIVPAIFMLGYTIGSNKYVGYLTILMLLTHWQLEASLGGGEGFGNNLAHVTFATSFLIMALALFLKNYYALAFLLTGLMINIHAPLALSMLGILSFSFLAVKPSNTNKLLGFCALSLLVGFPTFAWYLQTTQGSDNVSPTQWNLLNQLRSSHSLPSNWYFGTYIRFITFAVPTIFLVAIKNRVDRAVFMKILGAMLAILLMCVVSFAFVEIYSISFITKLSLFRSTRFLIILSSSVLGTYLILKVKNGEFLKTESILASLLIIALITWNVKIALGLEIMVFGWFSFKYRSIKYSLGFISLFIFSLLGLLIVPKNHIFPLFDNLDLFFAVTAISTVLCVLILRNPNVQKWAYSAAVLVAFMVLASMGSFDNYSKEQKQILKAQKEAQIWTRENTNKESVILVPPKMFGWENYSKRSNFLNFIDLAFSFYNPDLTPEIMKRVEDYGIDLATFKDSAELCSGMYEKYYGWDGKYIETLAKKNHITAMVVESARQKTYRFPLAYKNEYFEIYKLD